MVGFLAYFNLDLWYPQSINFQYMYTDQCFLPRPLWGQILHLVGQSDVCDIVLNKYLGRKSKEGSRES